VHFLFSAVILRKKQSLPEFLNSLLNIVNEIGGKQQEL